MLRYKKGKKSQKYNIGDRRMSDARKAMFAKKMAKAQKAEEKKKVVIQEESESEKDDDGIEMLALEYQDYEEI